MPLVTAKTQTAVAVSTEAVSGDGGGGTAATVVEEPVAAAADSQGVDTLWALGGFVLVVGASVGAWGLYELIEPEVFQAGAGFSAFAPLYIVAQGIERLLEPFSNHLARAKDDDGSKKSKKAAANQRDFAFAKVASPPAGMTPQQAAETAAKAQAFLDRVRRNTAVIAWGLASALAMAACGAFGIRMLHAIGFDVPPFWDIALTGLAIGSGTKPLHDLISSIQKSKDAKEDKPTPVAAA